MHNATAITTGSANQRPNTPCIRLWIDVTFRGLENSYIFKTRAVSNKPEKYGCLSMPWRWWSYSGCRGMHPWQGRPVPTPQDLLHNDWLPVDGVLLLLETTSLGRVLSPVRKEFIFMYVTRYPVRVLQKHEFSNCPFDIFLNLYLNEHVPFQIAFKYRFIVKHSINSVIPSFDSICNSVWYIKFNRINS